MKQTVKQTVNVNVGGAAPAKKTMRKKPKMTRKKRTYQRANLAVYRPHFASKPNHANPPALINQVFDFRKFINDPNASAFAPPRAQDGDDGSEYAFFKIYGASPFGTARADDDERSEGSL